MGLYLKIQNNKIFQLFYRCTTVFLNKYDISYKQFEFLSIFTEGILKDI